jgi:amino acid transporter
MAVLARRLGLFAATMLVMGGIVGSSIFMNPCPTGHGRRPAAAGL